EIAFPQQGYPQKSEQCGPNAVLSVAPAAFAGVGVNPGSERSGLNAPSCWYPSGNLPGNPAYGIYVPLKDLGKDSITLTQPFTMSNCSGIAVTESVAGHFSQNVYTDVTSGVYHVTMTRLDATAPCGCGTRSTAGADGECPGTFTVDHVGFEPSQGVW